MAEELKGAPLLVGIDAGGTFTDLVCFRGGTEPSASSRSRPITTTWPVRRRRARQPAQGFPYATVGAIHLATRWRRTPSSRASCADGLILIGYDRKRCRRPSPTSWPADRVAFVAGGHDLVGDEKEPLDEEPWIGPSSLWPDRSTASPCRPFSPSAIPPTRSEPGPGPGAPEGLPVTCATS